MAEVYKLPGSSYEEIVKIIRAYALASKMEQRLLWLKLLKVLG